MKKMSYSRVIALGFAVMILVGTLLLMLPISTKSGVSAGFSDAFFTAVSAQCVTGLVVQNTAAHWSIFGQIVILILIQIGGLGFITIATFVSILLHRKLSITQRGLFQESMNTLEISGAALLTKQIMHGVFMMEFIGAVLLAIGFSGSMPPLQAIYFGVFHSISAFCNAGFSLTIGDSMVGYADNVLVNVVLMLLIVIGGIGFIVWKDLLKNKFNFKKYKLHTKMVLSATLVLIFVGALIFFFTEKNETMAAMPIGSRILRSMFASITARTAGFNSVNVGAMSEAGKLTTMVLMFIGGSPGSTAGGIKTTTIVVIGMFVMANLKGKEPNIFGKSLEYDAVRKAATVFGTNLMLVVISSLIITAFSPFNLADVAFESISAIGTVGMTTGITPHLFGVPRFVIAILMYLGRVGSMSFAVSFFETKKKAPLAYATEKIAIG